MDKKQLALLVVGVFFLFANIACAYAEENNSILNDTNSSGDLLVNFTNDSNLPDDNQTFIIPEENNTDDIGFNGTEPLNESIENQTTNESGNLNYTNDTLQIAPINETLPNFLNIFMSVISPSYFFNMFTLGLQGFITEGSTKQARILSTAFQPGTRNAQSASYTANVGFFAGTVPSLFLAITNHSIYPTPAVVGSNIRFGISAQNAQAVWLNITLPDSSHVTINLVNDGYVYYVANSIGIYNVTFYANSTSGAITSVIDSFEITSVQPPYQPPSGGGGGGVSCTTVWDCDSWSICSNGIQTRTCTNKGTCTSAESKPIETRNCSESLFDVNVKLKNVELTENASLKFTVDLIERNGVDKIDVQVTYSLFDKDRNLLYSQIETKAVQGRLFYTKEITEIMLSEGEYTLRIDILYNSGEKAYAEQSFSVIGQKIKLVSPGILGMILAFLVEAKYLLAVALLAAILALLLRGLLPRLSARRKISKEFDRVSTLFGKEIYSADGLLVGKIIEVLIKGNRIYGLDVKIDKNLSRKMKKAIINYKSVKSVGEVVIVGEEVTNYLKRNG